jgi:UDP-3-O-[3-hydroxymyristoyl] glucosamine N-acyltransferase
MYGESGEVLMNDRMQFAKRQRQKHPQEPYVHTTVHIPDWVKLGKNITIHENCTIGTEGFGFEKDDDGKWFHIPHSGGVLIGDDVEIFAGTNVDRGTINDTIIGKGTKIDHHCHIGHNVQIGENCIITAKTVIAGSTKVGSNVWIGPHSTLLDHLVIGDNVYIGAHTNVIESIADNSKVVGNPGKVIGTVSPEKDGVQ